MLTSKLAQPAVSWHRCLQSIAASSPRLMQPITPLWLSHVILGPRSPFRRPLILQKPDAAEEDEELDAADELLLDDDALDKLLDGDDTEDHMLLLLLPLPLPALDELPKSPVILQGTYEW